MPIDADAIVVARAVRVEDVIARHGIKLRRVGAERVGPCPVCGGTDRFAVNVKKGTFNCRGCGAKGGVIDLEMHITGAGFPEAIGAMTGIGLRRETLVLDPIKQAEAQARDEAKARDELADVRKRMMRARSIWQEAVAIEGTLVERYLRDHRRLDIPAGVSGDVLRFHGKCPYGTAHYPCMIALARNVINDREQAVHRTALTPSGAALKLDGKTARLSLGPIGRAAIKLSDGAEVANGLTVGEGIETVIAAMNAPTWYRPAWSVIDSGNLKTFPVLPGIESLTILVDHDKRDQHGRRAGQRAAVECARRWDSAGREVITIIPTVEGEDMADVAQHRRA
jgi:putative DNA primase/helicase